MSRAFLIAVLSSLISSAAIAAPGDVKLAMMSMPNPFCGPADLAKVSWTSCDLAADGSRPASCDNVPIAFAGQSSKMCALVMNGSVPLGYLPPPGAMAPPPPSPKWPPLSRNFGLSAALVQAIRFRSNMFAEMPPSFGGDWTHSPDLPADCANLRDAVAPQDTPASLNARLPNWRSCLDRLAIAADQRLVNSVGGQKLAKIESNLETLDPDNADDAKVMNDTIIQLQKMGPPGASLDQVMTWLKIS